MGFGNTHTLRNHTGSVNWAAVTALAACITAAAAIAMTLMVFRQMQDQTRRLEFNTALESLWRLDADWNSDGMLNIRSVAADGLLGGRPTRELGAILDFFRDVQFLIDRGAADAAMVAHQFAWPLQMYWQGSSEVRNDLLENDPGAHQDLEKLVARLIAVEAERRHDAGQIPTPQQVRDFLRGELEHNSCADPEDEADMRRTPL